MRLVAEAIIAGLFLVAYWITRGGWFLVEGQESSDREQRMRADWSPAN